MKQSDIQRYEKALLKTVPGLRLRKKVRAAFRASAQALLEDIPEPNYYTLLRAFGPPESMAEVLIHTIPNPPRPLSRKMKAGIAGVICFLILAMALGLYSSWEVPESKLTISDGSAYPPDVLGQNYVGMLVDEFRNDDVTWDQPREYSTYLVLLYNKNDVTTHIAVRYAKPQSPHTFDIPPHTQRALLVEDARSTTHILSFITDNGTLDGDVHIYAAPIED